MQQKYANILHVVVLVLEQNVTEKFYIFIYAVYAVRKKE